MSQIDGESTLYDIFMPNDGEMDNNTIEMTQNNDDGEMDTETMEMTQDETMIQDGEIENTMDTMVSEMSVDDNEDGEV